MFNLLALVWLELARLVFFLGLLAWLGLVGLVALLCFFRFAVVCLHALLRYGAIYNACLGWFHLARLGLSPLGLVWLGWLPR